MSEELFQESHAESAPTGYYAEQANTPPYFRTLPTFDETPLTGPTGLIWHDQQSGTTMTNLGRLTGDRFRELAVLDLRVILAHLDSAAQAIKAELELRA
jgi:hypothetical protein